MDDVDFDRLMEIQRMTATRIRQEFEVDNKVKILTIMTDLSPGNKKIQVEAVIVEADTQGLTESEVIATLDALKVDGLVIEPETGYIQLT